MPISTAQRELLRQQAVSLVSSIGALQTDVEAPAPQPPAPPPPAPPPPAPPPPAPPSWTAVATEGETFDLTVASRVRYGADTRWVERDMPAGPVLCGNATFGDPAFETAKHCEIWTGAQVPTPAPPAPAPGPAQAFYFAANGDNSASGSVTQPKRDLTGLNVNALPAGTQLLFRAGDTFSLPTLKLANTNVTRENPLTFGVYGQGSRPTLQWSFTGTAAGFEFGLNYMDPVNHGGYVFRGLRMRGPDGTNESWGFWPKQNVDGVVIEDCEITNWYIGVYAQGGHNSRHVDVLRNRISGNRGMGILGTFYDSLIEGNDFSGSTLEASHFVHQIYMRDGDRNVLRGNRYVTDGPARSGTFTYHGYCATSLIVEDNEAVYAPGSDEGAWVISITESNPAIPNAGFNGLIVRGNKVTNAGNSAIVVQPSRGAVIENNEIRLTAPRRQAAVSAMDDLETPRALNGPCTVRNNRTFGPPGSDFYFNAPPGSTVEGNTHTVESV